MAGEVGHWMAGILFPKDFVAWVWQGTRHWARLERSIGKVNERYLVKKMQFK